MITGDVPERLPHAGHGPRPFAPVFLTPKAVRSWEPDALVPGLGSHSDSGEPLCRPAGSPPPPPGLGLLSHSCRIPCGFTLRNREPLESPARVSLTRPQACVASVFSCHCRARESLRHGLSQPSHPDVCETLEVCASQALVNTQDHDDGSQRPPQGCAVSCSLTVLAVRPGPPRRGSSRRHRLLPGRGRPSRHCPLRGDGDPVGTPQCPSGPLIIFLIPTRACRFIFCRCL